MSRDAHAYRWSDLTKETPMGKLSRRRIRGERVMLAEVVLEKGCFVPTHAHENEQISCLLTGKLRFGIGNDGPDQEMLVLEAGQVLHLPSNVPHSAEALETTRVLDVFSPVSETTGIDRG